MEPSDSKNRELILKDLDNTYLVEAAAGTGKTTCMVGRMVNLIAEGKCVVDKLVAVTFTRKAAAELRARFQLELEKAARGASGESRRRLQDALSNVERCFVGTIHSFCARLLRERPIEAGVNLDFEEIDDEEDDGLRKEAWEGYVARLYAQSSPLVNQLEEVGLSLSDIEDAFAQVSQYSDVEEWPCEPVTLPTEAEMSRVASKTLDYASYMKQCTRDPIDDPAGTNKLFSTYCRLARMVPHANLSRLSTLMAVMEEFGIEDYATAHRNWPGGQKQGGRERDRWNEFVSEYSRPMVTIWRLHRYRIVLDAIRPAVECCEQLRRERGVLNFQDLLLRAASLLRDKSHLRGYFRKRITHLLVDEFQDTDPIQAEMLLLLTADDPKQTDWRKCRPHPGSLFVVGDPKQSIYRFRRADIVTYNQVKKIIGSCGKVVSLCVNFRCQSPIVEWVNGVFSDQFNNDTADRDDVPRNVPLDVGVGGSPKADLLGIRSISVPPGTNARSLKQDADLVARFIRKALDDGLTVARTPRQLANGMSPRVQPGDFMILSYKRDNMQAMAQRLHELGIPCEVTGGTSLNEVTELAMLRQCVKAVLEPHDPVALVAALRGRLFGVSDAWLYAFKKAGGRFNFRSNLPDGLAEDVRSGFADAFERLSRYASWFAKLPAGTAVLKTVQDLGLAVWAAIGQGGSVRCGSIGKAIELLRAGQSKGWTAIDILEQLDQMVNIERKFDGIAARPPSQMPVRLINLHKAKGLEAPVVFLACPAGTPRDMVTLCIDRSGPRVLGYLSVLGKATSEYAPRPVLAQPAGWEELAQRERAFLSAEITRLRYVAATRAGSALIISQRREEGKQRGNRYNFWAFFKEAMEGQPILEDAGERHAPAVQGSPIDLAEADQAAQAISDRWTQAHRRSYILETAKSSAASAPVQRTGSPAKADGQQGADWGTAIHGLLEAMAVPGCPVDLRTLAKTLFDDLELPLSAIDEAIQTVEAVASSPVWQRAMRSSKRFVEVPFVVKYAPDADSSVPRIVRGAIDLLFQEEGGWVIVDYKTDSAGADTVAEKYRPQLEEYRRAWEQISGENTKETGLYLTRHQRYVRVS